MQFIAEVKLELTHCEGVTVGPQRGYLGHQIESQR